jgi:hypothetical protein
MDPVDRVKSLGRNEAGMLEVSLQPAAVPLRQIDHRRRTFLVIAFQIGDQPHLPAGAAHQCGLDVVMAQDPATERSLAGQLGERAVLDERGEPYDGIVAPVVRLAELPVVQSCRRDGTIEPARELLDAGEHGFAVGQEGHALDDPDARVAFHEADQAQDRVTRHDAVGVEHHHVTVEFAPAPAEVGEVAGLLVYAEAALSVEDAPLRVKLARQGQPRGLLGNPAVGIGRVAEDEEVAVLHLSRALKGLKDHPDPLHHPGDVLIANGHDDGSAAGNFLVGRDLVQGIANAAPVASLPPKRIPHKRLGGAKRNEDEEESKESEVNDAPRIESCSPMEIGHGQDGRTGQEQHERDYAMAPPGGLLGRKQ